MAPAKKSILMGLPHKSGGHEKLWYQGNHRAEHWYRTNQAYFLTARCRAKFAAFASEAAKDVFWEAFERYAAQFGYVPWVTSLMDNHWHSIGYVRRDGDLATMIQRLQGSVAKRVNDLLEVESREQLAMGLKPPGLLDHRGRLVPFWGDSRRKSFFDGCLRGTRQGQLTWQYVHTQCRRHGICAAPAAYPHTRVRVEMQRAIARTTELGAWLEGVPYRPKRWCRAGGL